MKKKIEEEYCEICQEYKKPEDMYDEEICIDCYEDKIEEAQIKHDSLKDGNK